VSDEEGGDGNYDAAAGGAAIVTGRWALRQVAQPSLRTAVVSGRWPPQRGPLPETCVVHGNKYTGLLNAVPM
jgi:hypothetical protein